MEQVKKLDVSVSQETLLKVALATFKSNLIANSKVGVITDEDHKFLTQAIEDINNLYGQLISQ